jgi:hypothetical protein
MAPLPSAWRSHAARLFAQCCRARVVYGKLRDLRDEEIVLSIALLGEARQFVMLGEGRA